MPAGYKLDDYYTPKHAAPAPAPAVSETASVNRSSSSSSSSPSTGGGSTVVTQSAGQDSSGGSSGGLSGTLSCSGLEELWRSAGGNPADAFMAAEIAEAESSGNQYALSPTDDYGYWQINVSHGPAEATFNPMGNAKAAIAISDDGSNWGAWTTYTDGLYGGRC